MTTQLDLLGAITLELDLGHLGFVTGGMSVPIETLPGPCFPVPQDLYLLS